MVYKNTEKRNCLYKPVSAEGAPRYHGTGSRGTLCATRSWDGGVQQDPVKSIVQKQART